MEQGHGREAVFIIQQKAERVKTTMRRCPAFIYGFIRLETKSGRILSLT